MKPHVQKPTEVTEAATLASELALPCVCPRALRTSIDTTGIQAAGPVVTDSVSPNAGYTSGEPH